MALGVMAARPGKLLLKPEVTLLAQASCYFTPKLFGGPGEPEASLGEPGFRKKLKMIFCPPFWVFSIFLIKTLNDHLFCTVTGVQHCKSINKDQKINKR